MHLKRKATEETVSLKMGGFLSLLRQDQGQIYPLQCINHIYLYLRNAKETGSLTFNLSTWTRKRKIIVQHFSYQSSKISGYV